MTKHSIETTSQVLHLRRTHSLRQVAEKTGLPLGTIKTLIARSGAFRDNPRHRELFTLPPITTSSCTDITVPELPPQRTVTGDAEIDAVLWLRSVISNGQPALIAKAKEAAARIRTPLKEIEKRYAQILRAANPRNPFATMSSFGFADLDDLAKHSIRKLLLRQEAESRFGDDPFVNTPAERFCVDTLHGLTRNTGWELDAVKVAKRFTVHPDFLPHTLSDCLHELAYWDALYRLRHAADSDCGDQSFEVQARETFVFGLLANIRPKAPDEAVAVFHYLVAAERQDDEAFDGILLNLLRGNTPTAKGSQS